MNEPNTQQAANQQPNTTEELNTEATALTDLEPQGEVNGGPAAGLAATRGYYVVMGDPGNRIP